MLAFPQLVNPTFDCQQMHLSPFPTQDGHDPGSFLKNRHPLVL